MIYLDNAATTYPKPAAVSKAVSEAINVFAGNPGRGSHSGSIAASAMLFSYRNTVASMFGAKPENTVFTYNATYALNAAIKASYIYGTHVLISDLEHNSVLRPVASVTKSTFGGYGIFDSALNEKYRTDAIISSIRTKMRPLTRTLVCTARSNVCGASMPIRDIGEFCRKNGLFFIVDAAQAAGFDDIDVERDSIDVLCVPGHKGLYGPTGTGALIFSEHGVGCGRIKSFIEGGSGFNSLDIEMPSRLPEMLEGGTVNLCGAAGLNAGIDFIKSTGLALIRNHETRLTELAAERLCELGGITLYRQDRSPIILFNVDEVSPEQIADMLDQKGICVRSGYHCAPLAHKRLGTPVGGGVRLSVGAFNTCEEIEMFSEVLGKITKA